MTESEVIKICNTIDFAASFSNPLGLSLNTTKEELAESMRMSIQALEKQKKIKEAFEMWKAETGGYLIMLNTRKLFNANELQKISEAQ